MKISSGTQKAILSSLFYEKTGQNTPEGQPMFQPIASTWDKRTDIASTAKKLMEGSTTKDNRIFYSDKEVELTPSEVAVVKELFDGNKDKWDWTVDEIVRELQELFEGKKNAV